MYHSTVAFVAPKRVPPERPFGRKILVPELDKQMWLEVFITSDQTWVTVDANGDIITDTKVIEDVLRNPVTYIMSYDNGTWYFGVFYPIIF